MCPMCPVTLHCIQDPPSAILDEVEIDGGFGQTSRDLLPTPLDPNSASAVGGSDGIQDRDAGVVIIDGYRIDGWVDERRCDRCDGQRIYAETHDAFFCPRCNVWLDRTCSDPYCEFCGGRPAEPLPSLSSPSGEPAVE
jgi:hypothetical protein